MLEDETFHFLLVIHFSELLEPVYVAYIYCLALLEMYVFTRSLPECIVFLTMLCIFSSLLKFILQNVAVGIVCFSVSRVVTTKKEKKQANNPRENMLYSFYSHIDGLYYIFTGC